MGDVDAARPHEGYGWHRVEALGITATVAAIVRVLGTAQIELAARRAAGL